MPEEFDAPTELGIGPTLESPETTDTSSGQSEPSALFPPESSSESVRSESVSSLSSRPAPDETWRTADLRRLDLGTVPEDQREMLGNFQRQVRNAQGDSGARLEDLRRREEQLQSSQQELYGIQKAMAENQGGGGQRTGARSPARRQSINEMLSDPGARLDRDTRNGLGLVQSAIQEALEPYRGLLDQFPQIQRSVGQLTEARTGQLRNTFVTQSSEARVKYGDDIDNYADYVYRMTGTDPNTGLPMSEPLINRATGRPHTVESAYRMASGLTDTEAQGLRADDAIERQNAQDAMAGNVGGPTGQPAGMLTEAQARAELQDLGFGGR
jgi:hypothetical protein